MGAYAKDKKLLMHFFQESLAGVAIIWYTNLEPSRICSWRDLMDAFIRQYQYNSDMAPNRHVFDGGQDISVMRVGSSMPTTKVTNISGMSGMTRSRHVFTPPELPAGSKDKGKANENVVEREKISLVMKTETPIKKLTKKEDNSGKKEISAREATEFLKIIQ